MSTTALWFGVAALGLGGIGLVLGIIISAMEYSDEIKYGNGRETGFKDQHRK